MNLVDLVRQPHTFFERLRALPARPGRFLWLVLLSGLVGGLGTVLLSRPLLDAQLLSTETTLQGLTGRAAVQVPPGLLYAAGVLAGVVGGLLSWLVLWGMGSLGAGREGRAAEVYGASFLAPLLWGLVLLVLALLLPHDIRIPAPDLGGLQGEALSRAVNGYVQRVQSAYTANPLARFSTTLTYAVYLVQFALAYIGFRAMTGPAGAATGGASSSTPASGSTPASSPTLASSRSRALRGVGYPLVLLLLLGLAAGLLTLTAPGLTGLG